jgi:phosphotransferase system HPr-like phosphotransfer protein
MGDRPIGRMTIVVNVPGGLDARPIEQLMEIGAGFSEDIWLKVPGKRSAYLDYPMGLMLLGASVGTAVILFYRGVAAIPAALKIAEFLLGVPTNQPSAKPEE